MWEIWKRGGIGVYVDEGYMVGNNNPAFRAILTQGRSKEIPAIVLFNVRCGWTALCFPSLNFSKCSG